MRPRRSQSSWVGLKPTPAVIGVLAALAAVYLVEAIAHPPFIVKHLALHPRQAFGAEPWQLVSSALVHLRIGALISSAIGIWLFGSPVEEEVGAGRLCGALLAGTLAGGLASAGLALAISPAAILTGADPAAMASIAGFGVAYGARPLNLFGIAEMRASTCAWLFLGLSAIFYLFAADFVGLVGGAAGAGAGALVVRGLGLGGVRRLPERYRRWRIRRRYKVIPGGRDSRSYLN